MMNYVVKFSNVEASLHLWMQNFFWMTILFAVWSLLISCILIYLSIYLFIYPFEASVIFSFYFNLIFNFIIPGFYIKLIPLAFDFLFRILWFFFFVKGQHFNIFSLANYIGTGSRIKLTHLYHPGQYPDPNGLRNLT